MKAATIALRIADFLRRYPPFEFLPEEELVGLAQSGRVKFHEVEEAVFRTGQPRDQFIYVINQGRVRVADTSSGEEELIDLRGPGDLLGLQGIVSDAPYLYTGVAETDVLLYALPRLPFMRLVEWSPKAQRYLAAYFSLNAAYQRTAGDQSKQRDAFMPTTLRKGGIAEVGEPQGIAREALITVRSEASALQAAQLLQSKRVACVVVIDELEHPLGRLTDASLRERFIEGRVLAKETAGSLMKTDLGFAKPDDNTGKLLVRMARDARRDLIVTEDGTAETRAVGLVTEKNIFLQYGRFPTLLGEAIAEAHSIAEVTKLRDRVEAFILEYVQDRLHTSWLMEMTGVLNRALVARVLKLVEQRMAVEGFRAPDVPHTWLMMGSGGRDELLIRSAVYHALMYADPPEAQAAQVEAYFRELGRRATDAIRSCGFLDSPQGILASQPEWCLSESQMLRRYTELISEPVLNNVYTYRDAFDFRPVGHKNPLAARLREHIQEEIGRHRRFLRHMAKDSLLNQPPRTLFQEYVIDEQGAQRDELEIKYHALLPLVDVGRVLALAAGEVATTATYVRLRTAAENLEGMHEDQGLLLREAAEAFLVLACARAQEGLASGTDGATIRPANLDAETRTLLKTSFRTILGTLEHLAERYDLRMRS